MKYNQPYGISDPDAPYINGNPATGTMGSIPPAASIEHPQREIVNFITDARLTPDAADLRQLGKAIQSNGVIYCDDQGTVNQLVITVAPAVTQLIKGMVFIVQSPISNTGPSTLKVNSLAPVPIVRATDQAPLDLGDIAANSLQAYGFDGTSFQMIWSQRQPGAPIYLTAHRTYYVNGSTGSDSYDGTAAAVGGGHGPYATIQKAFNQIPLYNMNGYTVTIEVADGTYGPAIMSRANGSGTIVVNGNAATPASCVVNGVDQTALWFSYTGVAVYVEGFKVLSSGTADPGDGLAGIISAGSGAVVIVGNMEFGACQGAHMFAMFGGMITNKGVGAATVWNVSGGSTGNAWLAGHFFRAYAGGVYQSNAGGGPNITIPAAISFGGAFCAADFSSLSVLVYNSLSGAGVAGVLGYRYLVSNNSSISTGGGGANYYPGSAPGIEQLGGYYS